MTLSKKLLILVFTLFHLYAYSETMLVERIDPLSENSHLAVNQLFYEVVDTVKDKPKKINKTNKEGYTFLHQALINYAMIENWISLRKDKVSDRKSPHDMLNTSMDTIKILLNNGADPNILFPRDTLFYNHPFGREKHHFLVKLMYSEIIQFPLHIIELLFEHGLSADPPHRIVMEALIMRKVGSKEEYGKGLLQLAVKYTENINAVREEGSKHDGDTILHSAVRFDDLYAVRLFIEHGARLDIQDDLGYTPGELARFYSPFPFIRSYKMKKFFREEAHIIAQKARHGEIDQQASVSPPPQKRGVQTPKPERIAKSCARVLKKIKHSRNGGPGKI